MATRKKTTRSGGRSSAPRSGGPRTSAGRSSTRIAGAARGAAKRPTGKNAAKQGRSAKSSARASSTRGKKTSASRGTAARTTAARGSAAGRRTAGRQRKDLEDVTLEVERRFDLEEEHVPTPPSTLDLDRRASAAASGRAQMKQRQRKHTAADPTLTGGDVDADWEQAYFAGDESATADNPTPDQSEVEDIGKAVGLAYEDTEELKSTPKVERRDKKRWELDPASSEDYNDRTRRGGS